MTRGSRAKPGTEKPSVDLDLQVAVDSRDIPARSSICHWAEVTLASVAESRLSLSVRVVESDEIKRLNGEYRGKAAATNVLSFPFDSIPGVEAGYLGDIAICNEVVIREAAEQNKSIEAHWAHMVVHGILHLCGYDHIDDDEARDMEDLEVSILNSLGFEDPYAP